jgi:steroid delta-isomerase-like uncharacterized protein
MSPEQNKAVDRRWNELLNAQDLDGALALLSPNFVEHSSVPGMPGGLEGVRMFFSMQLATFPDMHGTILDQLADGDKVVHRVSVEATHMGPFMGIPATGRRVKFTLIDIIRYADGKMVEHWGEVDNLGLLQQLGLVPPPRGA